MRVQVHGHRGIARACYAELIHAALELSRSPPMRRMARWSWERFSSWLRVHPFELDTGAAPLSDCTTACMPPQRMRRFPPTMNCWERALHELAWFAARGTPQVSLYDHDLPQGRHIEIGAEPGVFLGAVANGAADQALDGISGGLAGGVQGALAGSMAGPYGALAGALIGAVGGVLKTLKTKPSDEAAPTPPRTIVAEAVRPKAAPRSERKTPSRKQRGRRGARS